MRLLQDLQETNQGRLGKKGYQRATIYSDKPELERKVIVTKPYDMIKYLLLTGLQSIHLLGKAVSIRQSWFENGLISIYHQCLVGMFELLTKKAFLENKFLSQQETVTVFCHPAVHGDLLY